MTTDRFLQHGMVEPLRDEAPSSWMCRLALAQGCSIGEMLDFLGLTVGSDVDLLLRGPRLAELRRRCNLSASAFALADLIMGRVGAAALGSDVLYRCGPRVPRFLFCPVCLGQGQPRTLSIYWRFLDRRYCPLHSCLMETNCYQCGMHLQYPHDMAKYPAGKLGFASQHRCQFCGAELSAMSPCYVDLARPGALDTVEGRWLWYGRKIVDLLALPSSGQQDRPRFFHHPSPRPLPSPALWSKMTKVIREHGGLTHTEGRCSLQSYGSRLRKSWGPRLLFSIPLDQAGDSDI